MTTTTTNPIETVFQNLGSQLLGDATGTIKSALTTFATNVKANPTPQAAAAQGAQLLATLLLSGPTLEQEGITQGADALLSLIGLIPSNPTV